MKPIQGTALENRLKPFGTLRRELENYGFSVGGNWDYDHGYLDKVMNEEQTVYLRIPFQMIEGTLDGMNSDTSNLAKVGTPFVLKHLYREGNDPDGSVGVVDSMVNQFQEPKNKDADIEEHWVEQARALLAEVEKKMQ